MDQLQEEGDRGVREGGQPCLLTKGATQFVQRRTGCLDFHLRTILWSSAFSIQVAKWVDAGFFFLSNVKTNYPLSPLLAAT